MKKLLVSTDLDATLLDHDTYDFEPALSAIAYLQNHRCPIIFNSSKTLAEQHQLRQSIQIDDPYIVENGSAVIVPPGHLGWPQDSDGDQIESFCVPYKELTKQLHALRDRFAYRFRGFSDLSAAEVADITGLLLHQAVAAKKRLGSEPLLWEDDESVYAAFTKQVRAMELHHTRGGRFRHVMARTDKGMALDWLIVQYRQHFPDVDWVVVALGDSPNDVPKLRVADIGVLIANPRRPRFDVEGVRDLRQPEKPGPEGWREAIEAIARELHI